MGKITTLEQVNRALISKMRIGESRHTAKAQARAALEKAHPDRGIVATEVRIDTIHSLNTQKAYKEHCTHFVKYCQEHKGAGRYANLSKLEQYAPEYLQYREKQGFSPYTVRSERAALGKLYGEKIDYDVKALPRDEITRSRYETAMDRHFSADRNRDLVTVCRGTGGRRSDIAKLTPESFFTRDNRLYVEFLQSKGGRNRVAPVLPEYREAIERFISTKEPQQPLFDKVHSALDVHSLRREYAQNLYELVKSDPVAKSEIQQQYPAYHCKGFDTYYSRDQERRFVGKKEDVAIVSQALGHTRLSVSVQHYLR